MNNKLAIPFQIFSLLTFCASLSYGCESVSEQTLTAQDHAISLLHADKPAQMRVRAADGSEYSAGQIQWLKARERDLERACKSGDESRVIALEGAITRALHPHSHYGQ